MDARFVCRAPNDPVNSVAKRLPAHGRQRCIPSCQRMHSSFFSQEWGQALGNRKNNGIQTVSKSIVHLAGKHQLEPNHLIDTFVDAWRNSRSHYKSLQITCRESEHDLARFLITVNENVVSQFPIHLKLLQTPGALKAYIEDIPIPTTPRAIAQPAKTVDALKAGMKGVRVTGKIVEVPPSKLVYSRWGSPCYVSNVELADETGSISMSLWNEDIHKVHVGDDVVINNGYVYNFRGEPQLRLRKKSTLSIIN